MAARYGFTTTWRIAAPVEDVWALIWDGPGWPAWWPGVEHVELLDEGGPGGIGRRASSVWRSRTGYRVRFQATVVQAEQPHLLVGVTDGQLRGIGRWRLAQTGPTTTAVYDYDVETTVPWMKALAPIARPIFRSNHDALMRAGGAGLARRAAGRA